jgi:hypothetical protein
MPTMSKRHNQFWECIPYGAHSSEYLLMLEDISRNLVDSDAIRYLHTNTHFSKATVVIWLKWLRSKDGMS